MTIQELNTIQSQGIPNNTIPNSLGGLISLILPTIFSLAGMALLVFLVTAGLSYMLARGDQRAMEAAKARITTALIGFIIIFLSYSLVKLVGLIFGIEIIGKIFNR